MSRIRSRRPSRLSHSIITAAISATYGARRKNRDPLIGGSGTISNWNSTRSDHSRDGADAMTIDRRKFLRLIGASAAALPSTAWALDYPSRPIRVIVPYPAGGPNDTIARLFTSKLSESWRQPIYIENVPA